MMEDVAYFEKVSFKQFKSDMDKTFNSMYNEEFLKTIWDNIKLPQRATIGSAGYDFFAPLDITIPAGTSIVIPTGIRCGIDPGGMLGLYPRSGLGFKYRLRLNNTVGIIDSDYFYSDNEGHIQAKLSNENTEGKIVQLKAGEAYIQGIFTQYGITYDDNTTGVRNGGFGSTTK